jgi:hypothetical protein
VRPGGVLLVLAGVWVLCQVLAGNALQRLGLSGADSTEPKVTVPDKGYSNVPHNPQGFPL